MKQIYIKNKQIVFVLCIMIQIILTGLCLAGCSFAQNDTKYAPLGNHLTDVNREVFFQKRGEKIYRTAIDGIWYPFGWESPYLLVNMGANYPVMLTSGKTFDYKTENGEKFRHVWSAKFITMTTVNTSCSAHLTALVRDILLLTMKPDFTKPAHTA